MCQTEVGKAFLVFCWMYGLIELRQHCVLTASQLGKDCNIHLVASITLPGGRNAQHCTLVVHMPCAVLQNVWSEVLRCVSRWELLQQLHSGGPTDALLFSPPPAESPASNPLMKLRDRLLMRAPAAARPFAGIVPCLLPCPHPQALAVCWHNN